MTDYIAQVIAHHKKTHDIDDDRIVCFEMNDWVKRQISEYNIDELVVDYVDFIQMILDSDYTIYVRREKEICSYYGWLMQDNCVWKGREKHCLATAPRNSVFLICE
jgi:hypothetical protein